MLGTDDEEAHEGNPVATACLTRLPICFCCRFEALAAAPHLLLQKLEGQTEGLPGADALPAQQQQQAVQQVQQQGQLAASQQAVLVAANTQRAAARSCSGVASLSTKQPQQASQAVWPPPGEGQRQSSKAARQSGSTTRFPPSFMQPRPGPVPLSSGALQLRGSILGGSLGGAGGSRGAAGSVQQQQFSAGLGSGSGWSLEDQEEEAGPAAGLVSGTPQHLPRVWPSRQPLGSSGGNGSSPAWLGGREAAALDRLFGAAPSGGAGKRQGPADLLLGGSGAQESDELDRLFRSAKRQQLGQHGQQGQLAAGDELERSWWDREPEQAHAEGWDSRAAAGSAPPCDLDMQQEDPWQLPRTSQKGGQQLGWSPMGPADLDPTQQPLQPKQALHHGAGRRQQQQQQQQQLGVLLPAEQLPAFLAPSPKAQQRRQHDWGADGLLGSNWGATSSSSGDDLPAFFL